MHVSFNRPHHRPSARATERDLNVSQMETLRQPPPNPPATREENPTQFAVKTPHKSQEEARRFFHILRECTERGLKRSELQSGGGTRTVFLDSSKRGILSTWMCHCSKNAQLPVFKRKVAWLPPWYLQFLSSVVRQAFTFTCLTKKTETSWYGIGVPRRHSKVHVR